MTERPTWTFWGAVAVGGAVMAWGVVLFLRSTSVADARFGLLTHLVGIDLLHDLLVAPLVCLAGVLLARLSPGRWRAPLQAGAIVSASLLAVAVLPLVGSAEGARNATIQPLDYRTSTLVALGATWAAVVAWGVARSVRR